MIGMFPKLCLCIQTNSLRHCPFKKSGLLTG